MPRRDGSGPYGAGPATGRGYGACTGYSGAGPGYGRGFGMGRGRGYRCFAPGYFQPAGYGPGFAPYAAPVMPDESQRRAFLENQVQALEARLQELKSQLDQPEK